MEDQVSFCEGKSNLRQVMLLATKLLLAIVLLLPMIAETSGIGGLEEVSSEAPDEMQKQLCLIGEELKAKFKLERRFKSMGNSGAAGRFGDERRSLEAKEKALLQQMRNENPEISVPQC